MWGKHFVLKSEALHSPNFLGFLHLNCLFILSEFLIFRVKCFPLFSQMHIFKAWHIYPAVSLNLVSPCKLKERAEFFWHEYKCNKTHWEHTQQKANGTMGSQNPRICQDMNKIYEIIYIHLKTWTPGVHLHLCNLFNWLLTIEEEM